MEPKERASRNDRQHGDGFSRSTRHNFDRICLNNLDLSSLGAAAAPPLDEQKMDNSAERPSDLARMGDEAVITEALLNRMHRLINTYPRAAPEHTSRLRVTKPNRNGSSSSLDHTMDVASRSNILTSSANHLLADVSEINGPALANNLRDRNASGSNSGIGVGQGSGDLSAHQMRNDLRSGNTSYSLSISECSVTPHGDGISGLSQDSRMSGMNRIVSQLMQIRESIQQANSSINDVSEHEHTAETARHVNRMQELIQKLRQQEEAYIQLLSQMVDEDRASRDESIAMSVDRGGPKSGEQNGNDEIQDEVESVDVPTDIIQPSDGENTAESSSGAAEVTQSDTAYVEDAYAELEQLRCQRDMLREILSQHEELRALQGRQVALLKMQRETQQQLLEAQDKPEDGTSDDALDDDDDLQQLMLMRRGVTNRQPNENEFSSGVQRRQQESSSRIERESVENLDAEDVSGEQEDEDLEQYAVEDDDKESDYDPRNDPLMSTAVPRELLELRRRLNQFAVLRQQQQEQQQQILDTTAQPSSSLHSTKNATDGGDAADSEYTILTKSKAELSDRLKDLQSKKDHLDSLLMQLQTLRDLRTSQNTDDGAECSNGREDRQMLPPDTGSTTSSVRQISHTLDVENAADNTVKDAEETLQLLEAQRKLSKLKEVRERLDRVRSMMTYYQDATAFIHSGEQNEDQEEARTSSTKPVAVARGAVGGRGSDEVRQRILDYGSASETSSHTSEPRQQLPKKQRVQGRESITSNDRGPSGSREPDDNSIQSEQIWAGHPSLLDRIRQLKLAKNRLNQLQSLITEIEAGASLSELPADLASVAAELINEESPQLVSMLVPGGSEMGATAALGNTTSDDDLVEESANALLSSYKSAVEDQKRELSQLMGERDKLLALQRQMEQLHASLPSSVWSRSRDASSSDGPGKSKETTEAAEVALRSLRLRPPPSSSAAAASMEALTAALSRGSKEEEEATSTASTQQSQTGGASGRRPDTVTFQEPVATFVANDEVYENICAQRMMREELRQKKREIAAIMKKDNSSGGYKRNQGGSTAGTDNQSMDTAVGTLYSQDMTTAATWGDGSVMSNAEGDADDGVTESAGIERGSREHVDTRTTYVNNLDVPSQHLRLPRQNDNSMTSPTSLHAQVSSTSELCRAMLVEQRKLVGLLQEQNLRYQLTTSAPELPSASLLPPQIPLNSSLPQNLSPMLYSSVNFCCQRLIELQGDILSLQQQINAVKSVNSGTSLCDANVSRVSGSRDGEQQSRTSTNPGIPPLDLSTMKQQHLRQHQDRIASNVSREVPRRTPAKRRRSNECYRPGVSSGISGTGYSENIEGDLDDVISLLSCATDDVEETKRFHLNSALNAAQRLSFGESSGQPVGSGPFSAKASKKQLKQHDIQGRISEQAWRTGANMSDKRDSLGLGAISKHEATGQSGDEVGLFEALRETIYAEVASLISQNESRPNYLIDLFRELQLLSSDYLRQRVLYAIQDLVNKSLVHQSSLDSKIFAPRASWLRPGRDGFNEEQTPSESLITTDDDGGQDDVKLYDGTLKKLEVKASQLFQQGMENKSSAKPGLLSTITDCLGPAGSLDQASADYAEEVETVSSLSTPQASPFAADSLGDTVIHLDKQMSPLSPISNTSPQEIQTMQLLRDLEEQRHRYQAMGSNNYTNSSVNRSSSEAVRNGGRGDDILEPTSETSSVSEGGACPNVDPQQLNEEIRGVIHFLVPMLKQVSPQICTSNLLQWIKELIMRRIRLVISRIHGKISNTTDLTAGSQETSPTADLPMDMKEVGEFDRFFDKQLSSLLQENLKQYEGKVLAECIEDLMVDVSELLFNELAFFKLIADLEQNPSSDDFESKTSSPAKHSRGDRGEQTSRDARLEAVAAVVTLALQGDEEELDNKRDDQMANQAPVSSPSSEEEDAKKVIGVRGSGSGINGEQEGHEEEEDGEEEEEEEERSNDSDASGGREPLSSSVSAVLAPSETKPMTRIGSDEDDDDEEEEDAENHCGAECADTAVSYVDADEKDALFEGSTEKTFPNKDDLQAKEEVLTNGAEGDLTLDDLPNQFDLICKPSDVLQTLPSGEGELAGNGDACPPLPGPVCDQRALGQ